MGTYMGGNSRYGYKIDESNVVGEILEDIECLDIDDDDFRNTDELNADTFGDFMDSKWDPTETFKEAELFKNKVVNYRRGNNELKKFDDFDFKLKKSPDYHGRHKRNEGRGRRVSSELRNSVDRGKKSEVVDTLLNDDTPTSADVSTINNSSNNDLTSEEAINLRLEKWEDDVKSYRDFGLFEITDDYIDMLSNGKNKLCNRFKLSLNTFQRLIKGIVRNENTIDCEFFMNDQEFDRILRIHLAQVCKDPKLQNYSGKWNLYHLGIKKRQDDDENKDLSPDVDDISSIDDNNNLNDDNNLRINKLLNNPNKFGKVSIASIRHGRRLINLNDDKIIKNKQEIDIKHKIRVIIEICYETLFILNDLEYEIDKCPMNHVSALDKMQKDHNYYLHELYTLLNDNKIFNGILNLDKGRLLIIKIGKKLNIEMKLLLLCKIIENFNIFINICNNIDLLFINEITLKDFLILSTNINKFKSLIAFEGDEYKNNINDDDNIIYNNGIRIHLLLYNSNTFSKLYLFIIEGIILAGNLFILKDNNGNRITTLQKITNIIINSQKYNNGFKLLLNTRSGILFTNILLEIIHQNKDVIDQNTIDLLLHYTIDTSEYINSNQNEWNTLANNILKMF